MKKLTAMLLVLALMLSLCACGEKNVSGTVSPQEEQTEVDFQLGVTTGGKYESTFLGIGCSLAAGLLPARRNWLR